MLKRFLISILIVTLEPILLVMESFISLNGRNGEKVCRIIRGKLYGIYWNCEKLQVGSNVKLVNPHRFQIGKNVTLHSSGTYVTSPRNHIKIGDNSHVSRYAVIAGSGNITIGSHCAISSHVVMYSVSTNFENPDELITQQPAKSEEITVGNNVLIGAGAILLPGVTIGDNSVIGAGSLVNKDIPENSIAAGVPAQIIRSRT